MIDFSYLDAVPHVLSSGEYSFPALTKSSTCAENHPATSLTVQSRRKMADSKGVLPVKSPGIVRAMQGTVSEFCLCPHRRIEIRDVQQGLLLQLKLGSTYVPCEVCVNNVKCLMIL
jgi:hypothetical protein